MFNLLPAGLGRRPFTSGRDFSIPPQLWRYNLLPRFGVPLARARSAGSNCTPQHKEVNGDPVSGSPAPPQSAYIHLPFCKRRCFYCDFPIQVVGRHAASPGVQTGMAEYVDLLCSEIVSNELLGTKPLRTVFFGGGTPSLIPPGLLEKIIKVLDQRMGISSEAEICIEADPGTFDAPKLRAYLSLGVTRLSIGVQSFQQDLLELCGRSHTLPEVWKAIDDVHSAGPRSWSLDLISSLPTLTLPVWEETLGCTIEAKPDHVSVYDLQVEEGTPFARWYQVGKDPLPSEAASSEMYATASQMLRNAGYEHYEVSNYAFLGHRCRHNMAYWNRDQFYAFGLGATSYLQGRSFSRPRKMVAYREWAERFSQTGGGVPGGELPEESIEDRMLDAVMLRLRLRDGLDLTAFGAEFGSAARQKVVDALRRFEGGGLVEHEGNDEGAWRTDRWRNGRVRLADPGGWLVSNDIISEVFVALTD